MRISASRYLYHLIAIALLSVVLLTALNWLVDPYALFGAPRIQGLNAVKAVISSKQRVYETVTLLAQKPPAVILGTSRSDIGIRPDHPALPAGGFNAAMSGQQIGESRRLLQEMVTRPGFQSRVAVLGLDFFAFNVLVPTPFDYAEENFHTWRRAELLFSITTSLDAWRTLIRQNREFQLARGGLLRDDGFRDYIGNPRLAAIERFRGSEDGYLRYTYKPPPGCEWRSTSLDGRNDSFEEFRLLLAIAHQHNIDLRLFVSPSHARQWEALASASLWEKFEDWKRRLVQLNLEEAQRANRAEFPIWDFSGYNSITTEPVLGHVDQEEPKYYWESSHFRAEVGDLVMDRMFSFVNPDRKIPHDFGDRISITNIEEWLMQTRARQQTYRRSQPLDYEDVFRVAAAVKLSGTCSRHKSVSISGEQRPEHQHVRIRQ